MSPRVRGARDGVKPVKCRRATADDRSQIDALFRDVFGASRPPTRWQWQYERGPAGPAEPWIAIADGRVVSQVATVVLPFVAGGADVRAAHSVDAMTIREWRRMGLQRRLFARMIDELRERDVSILFGFTNEHSTAGALGYQERHALGPFPLLARPLSASGMLAAIPRLLRGHAATTPAAALPAPRPVRIPAGIDALWMQSLERSRTGIRRDSTYQAWRWAKPDGRYRAVVLSRGGELEGFGVLAFREQAGLVCSFVAEFLALPAPTARLQLARSLLALAHDEGAHVAFSLAFPGSEDRATWLRTGFVPVAEWLNPEKLVLSARAVAEPAPAGFRDPSQWVVRWGDHDVL